MNGHPQYEEALALYAMDALDDPRELAALEAHLGTCGDCRSELEALRADMALLGALGYRTTASGTVAAAPDERHFRRASPSEKNRVAFGWQIKLLTLVFHCSGCCNAPAGYL